MRRQEAADIRAIYQDRVPIIVERAPRANIADIDKKKYLVPGDLSGTLSLRSGCHVERDVLTTAVSMFRPCVVGLFSSALRRRINLTSEQALWLFVETVKDGKKTQILPPAT